MTRPMPAEELGGEPGNKVDVLTGVPLVASSDRLDCLGKYHDGACGLGELLETGQARLANRCRAGAMEAYDYRRNRRARWGLGHEVRAIGVACGEDLVLESHGASIADGSLSGRRRRGFLSEVSAERATRAPQTRCRREQAQ